ncbi:MAG: Fe(2+)-trafficking protein [Phycisphaeraceae bacterium]
MATLEERIAQWEKMAREVPDDMAFFSLGSAYREAERLDDADRAFARAIEMNPQMSRAYQLRGQVLIKLGREAEAGPLLTEGYHIAAQRGDVMPKRAIGSLLEKLGLEVPEVEELEVAAGAGEAGGENMVVDRRTGQPQQRLDDPPMRGPVGRFIYDHFGQQTWRAWIAQGTKVINELRLDFSNPQHQEVYDQHMLEWLGVSQEEVDAYARQVEGRE